MKKRTTTVVLRTEFGLWWICEPDAFHHEEKPFSSEEQVELELAVLGWRRASKTYDGMLADAKLFDIKRICDE